MAFNNANFEINNIQNDNIQNDNMNIENINDNILNNRPEYFIENNRINYIQNNHLFNVPIIDPINWIDWLNNNNNNNIIREEIRINYEFWIMYLHYETQHYRNMIRIMEMNGAMHNPVGMNNINRFNAIIDMINDDVIRYGNYYMGVLQV